jgi:hypothetical protein
MLDSFRGEMRYLGDRTRKKLAIAAIATYTLGFASVFFEMINGRTEASWTVVAIFALLALGSVCGAVYIVSILVSAFFRK